MLVESVFIPEPCELAYGTALLLSSAGISIGSMLTSRDCMVLYYWSMVSSLTWSMLFILTQTNEFNYLGYYMNDSELGCIYISISGLHFIHVLYGVIVLGASSNPLHSPVPISTGPMDMYTTMDYYYWHMIELVYTYIYTTLYYYCNHIEYPLICNSYDRCNEYSYREVHLQYWWVYRGLMLTLCGPIDVISIIVIQ